MNPGDNEAGKRTIGSLVPVPSFSKKPLIRYPAGSPDFSPGPRAPVTQPSSQVFSLPLSAASSTLLSPWNSSASSFLDSLSMWSPSPSSLLQPQSAAPCSPLQTVSAAPTLLFSGSSSVPVEENRDFPIEFSQNPSFPSPRPNSMSVSDNTVSPRHRRTDSIIFGPNDIDLILNGISSHGNEQIEEIWDEIMKLNAEENGNDMIQTNMGVKRRAENNIDPIPKPYKRRTSRSGPYTPEELQKISTSKRLTELASDPKKVRMILANRETARQSKQRKSQYIIDLENKVVTLSNEIASLKAKLIISEKRCQALELRTRDSNKMQQQNVTTYEEMWNQSNINQFNQEQTNINFENPNGQF